MHPTDERITDTVRLHAAKQAGNHQSGGIRGLRIDPLVVVDGTPVLSVHK